MNKLSIEKRAEILSLLCEGSSLRSVSRVTGVSINTVTKLLVDAGNVCAAFHHERVQQVNAKNVQCDEIWSFTYCKARTLKDAKAAPIGSGDVWTWTGIDADSKLIISWHVGDRHHGAAMEFIGDLKARMNGRFQLSTDGHKAYLSAVEALDLDADYAMLIKIFGSEGGVLSSGGRYSPPAVVGTQVQHMRGNPNPKTINTSYVERHNLTMRMQMRRFTRLTNAFSKRLENHCHALALYFVWYNFIKIHKAHRMTPAMAAGVTDTVMDMRDIVAMIEEKELAVPRKRGPYKKRIAA